MTAPIFTLDELQQAAQLVHRIIPPTAQYPWPKLARRTGCEVWVKHENHTPTGAFKVRGGIIYMDRLRRSGAAPNGIITATRGNHGQSISLSAARAGIPATIYVPHGNSQDQNSAMRAFGANVVEFGKDFDEARIEASRIAQERSLYFVPAFHYDLVKGVASYALELFSAVSDLDAVYVAIGMGSGICGLITTRDLLGLKTEIIGVVARNAPAMALSFEAGKPISTSTARTFADGVATRDPQPDAFDIIKRGASRIVQVSEDEIAAAMRIYFEDTHQLAEGAGATPLAGFMQERRRFAGRKVGVILSGSNIDSATFQTVLSGATPAVS